MDLQDAIPIGGFRNNLETFEQKAFSIKHRTIGDSNDSVILLFNMRKNTGDFTRRNLIIGLEHERPRKSFCKRHVYSHPSLLVVC